MGTFTSRDAPASARSPRWSDRYRRRRTIRQLNFGCSGRRRQPVYCGHSPASASSLRTGRSGNVAGGGKDYPGDGGPATSAQIRSTGPCRWHLRKPVHRRLPSCPQDFPGRRHRHVSRRWQVCPLLRRWRTRHPGAAQLAAWLGFGCRRQSLYSRHGKRPRSKGLAAGNHHHRCRKRRGGLLRATAVPLLEHSLLPSAWRLTARATCTSAMAAFACGRYCRTASLRR